MNNLNCRHRTAVVTFAVLCVALTRVPIVNAQEDKAGADEAKQLQTQIAEGLSDQLRGIAQSHLLVQVNEMKRVCDLDEPSVKKLNIAAKGAADRFVRKTRNAIQQALNRMPVPPNVEVRVNDRVLRPGPKVDQNRKNDPFNRGPQFSNFVLQVQHSHLILYHKRRTGSSGRGVGGGGMRLLEQEPIWKKSLASNLTPIQKNQYDSAIAERRQRLHRVVVDFYLAQLDNELNLNEDQRQKIRVFVGSGIDLTNVEMNMIQYRVREQVRKIDDSKIKDLLSATQLKLWESYRQQW